MNRRAFSMAAIAVVGAALVTYAVITFRFIDRPEPGSSSADRAEVAREAIADFRENETPNYQQAYDMAQEHQREGRLADAQVLYFYAARGKHAPSELALATMNDPNHHSAQTSLLSEPDPFQAYKWYSAALEHGLASAAARLEALREWAKEAAANGDLEAERLLLQWQ